MEGELSSHYLLWLDSKKTIITSIKLPTTTLIDRTSGTYPGAFQRRSFNSEDITVTLPDGVDACDIGTITIWCQPFRAIFTRLAIPRNIRL